MKKVEYKPGPDQVGAVRIAILDDDELAYYKKDKDFQKFKKANRLAIWSRNELWAWEWDSDLIDMFGKSSPFPDFWGVG